MDRLVQATSCSARSATLLGLSLRLLLLQESTKAMVQEIAMYGSGVAEEESRRNPGASILENGRHEHVSGVRILHHWKMDPCSMW